MTVARCATVPPPRASRIAWVTLLALLALSGCASSPKVEYFTLEAVGAHQPKLNLSTSVQVSRVHVPPMLDRQQMVSHSGAYTLDISDQHRWSAPLDEMIRQVLTEDLIRMLPENSVILPNEPATTATDKIVVDILEFSPDASGTIHLDASWSLLPPDSHESIQSRLERLSERAHANDTADQVRAMSAALDELAARIAQNLAPHATGARGPAP